MTRTLKALGLALAVCSLGAVYASGASAATDVFTCGQATCIITGEQVENPPGDNVLGVKGAGVTTHCKKATFKSGTVSSGSSDILLTPAYQECETAGSNVPLDIGTGCQFTFSGVTDAFTNTNGVAEGEDGTAAIVNCAANQVIKWTYFGCNVSFGNQANKLGVRYANEFPAGKPDDILMTVTVDKLTYTASGEICDFLGFSTPGGSNAFLTETVTVKALEDQNGVEGATQINLTQS
jgi:hypothetical protein